MYTCVLGKHGGQKAVRRRQWAGGRQVVGSGQGGALGRVSISDS